MGQRVVIRPGQRVLVRPRPWQELQDLEAENQKLRRAIERATTNPDPEFMSGVQKTKRLKRLKREAK